MNMQQAIQAVIEGIHLSTEQMAAVMRLIMSGEATPAQVGGFLVGLRMKGETIDEITGAAQVMRELVTPVAVPGFPPEKLVDTCGTGGDGSGIFNVSTASAFVVAAAGGKVAKHGNRSVSSKSGSADLLEAAGVNLNLTPEQVGRCIAEIGIGFMFAPAHHSAMKHAIGPRREMGVRTIFNVLGPLTNPALVHNQVLGVFNAALLMPMAEVLQRLGSDHVLVLHSEDGFDEISLSARTQVVELHKGQIRQYSIAPEDFGIDRCSMQQMEVSNAEESLALIKAGLSKRGGAASDLIALNAGAAIYAANLSRSLAEGVLLAQDAIGGGLAREKITELANFTQVFAA